MTGTAVALPGKSGAVGFKYDAKAFDAAHMAARANAMAKAMGGKELGEGGNYFKPPGTKITFKKGVWSTGTKKADKQPIDVESDGERVIVFNQMSMVWVKWIEKNDKRLPEFVGLTNMLSGDEFPSRESLGDMDQDEWEPDMNGNPDDPWKPLMFIPVRRADSDTIDHIELSTKSASREGLYLFRKIGEAMAGHVGELPIVKLGASVYEAEVPVFDKKTGQPVMDKKTGKQKTSKIPVDKPKFEIVGWTAMKECDDPDTKAADASDEVGEVEAKSRGPAKALPKPEAEAKPAKGKAKRKVAVADDGDEI